MDNDTSHSQRLRAAVHFTVGRICQEVEKDCEKKFNKQVIAAIAETTFRQCDIFAKDLEAFARHAKRATITSEDVKLTARRSVALFSFITNKSEELISANQEQKERRKNAEKKRKSREGHAEAATEDED